MRIRTAAFVFLVAVIVVAFSTTVDAARWWNYPGDWQICRDSDGWVVYKPDGGEDAWSTGYSLREVENSYRLLPHRDYNDPDGENNRPCV